MSSRPILASLIAGLLAAAGPAIAADSSDVPAAPACALPIQTRNRWRACSPVWAACRDATLS